MKFMSPTIVEEPLGSLNTLSPFQLPTMGSLVLRSNIGTQLGHGEGTTPKHKDGLRNEVHDYFGFKTFIFHEGLSTDRNVDDKFLIHLTQNLLLIKGVYCLTT